PGWTWTADQAGSACWRRPAPRPRWCSASANRSRQRWTNRRSASVCAPKASKPSAARRLTSPTASAATPSSSPPCSSRRAYPST
ncbi:hypothetical protein H2201_009390, partial [Coniosporium apollinis]